MAERFAASAIVAFDADSLDAVRAVLKRRADSPSDFAVMLDHLAQVASEAILVELLARLRVPQPAAVGREFVAEHQLAVRIVERMAELELVVDEVDAGVC